MAAMRGWQKKASAADDARALLDSLMGPSRDAAAVDQKGEGFLDKNVCKRYLCGLCPNDWFKSTKREMDTCGKIHSDQLAEEMRAHPQAARYVAEFEQELFTFLEEICSDADRWVARERKNLRGPGIELQLSVGHQRSLSEKKGKYKDLIDESTRLGEAGEVQKSSEFMELASVLKKEMDEMLAKFTVETGGEDVCEACGVRFPLGNTPNEIGNRESHFQGKMHDAYTTIRKRLEELREKKKSGEWDRVIVKVGRDDFREAKDSRGKKALERGERRGRRDDKHHRCSERVRKSRRSRSRRRDSRSRSGRRR